MDRGELERQLAQSLQRIDGTADMICRGIELFDPDRIGEELMVETSSVGGLLGKLMATPAVEGQLCAEVERSIERLLALGKAQLGADGERWMAQQMTSTLARLLQAAP